jgi:hypothetical protein
MMDVRSIPGAEAGVSKISWKASLKIILKYSTVYSVLN